MVSPDAKMVQLQYQLRAYGHNARRKLSAGERQLASETIAAKVARAAWFQRSRNIGCYLGTAVEVDTWPIIARAWAMKKRIFAPVVEKKSIMRFRELSPKCSLKDGPLGILEPEDGLLVDPRQLDLVLTPLAAFDAENNRIGMGGGYFDRTFSFLNGRRHLFHPKLIGLAFACQKVAKIPPNPWDIRLFTVISES
jgi:5-formyltetrahydrofolate cyclo-ligase